MPPSSSRLPFDEESTVAIYELARAGGNVRGVALRGSLCRVRRKKGGEEK